jgi:hypothetical protein
MRKKFLWTLLIFAILGSGHSVLADEGMWVFNGVPKTSMQSKYGFEPSQAWLDHLRLASVRIGDSGAFVSPDGLILTNHHVGRNCILHVSTADKDLMKTGFYARTREEEIKCPGLAAEVLVGVEDITAKVYAGSGSSSNQTEATNAINSAAQKLQQQCSKDGLECERVLLYAGAVYHLYKYKKYSDVRLVFAPELVIAFLGGDPDNYTFPRYDLDIAVFRAYENNRPAHPAAYLPLSKTGVNEGELVFASGSPSSTSRMSTYAQLEFLRDYVYPSQIKGSKRRARLLKQYSEESPENARMLASMIWDLENRTKAIEGYLSGLLDEQEMAKRKAEEQQLRAKVARDPKLRALYGDPWTELEKAIALQEKLKGEKRFPETAGLSGRMAAHARTLVRYAAEMQKPNAERLAEFRAVQWPRQESALLNPAPIDPVLEELTLTDSLSQLVDDLGENDARVQKVLAGKKPADRAHELVYGSKLYDPAFRKALLAGGPDAIGQSTDPLVSLVRVVDPDMRAAAKGTVGRRNDNELTGIRVAVGKAMFAFTDAVKAPDATGSLRLSFGVVKRSGGESAFTNIGGAYSYAESKSNEPPYKLPDSWRKAAGRVDPTTPLNLVSTVDVIGGSSGSPLVDKKGELVGVVFDANQAMLAGKYVYQEEDARAIAVDVRGILEALRKIYGAGPLADELTGRGPSAQ